MKDSKKESRENPREYIEPYETGTYLEFDIDQMQYRFPLLDTSPLGMGMLVKEEESRALDQFTPGELLRAEYKTPEASMPMDFEVRHVTQIERGKFKGHYQVGLSFLLDD
jgi:hypothetical protein